jgi:hypothetical protein
MPLPVFIPPSADELGYTGDPLELPAGRFRVWLDGDDVVGYYGGSGHDHARDLGGELVLIFPISEADFEAAGGWDEHNVLLVGGERARILRTIDGEIATVEILTRFSDGQLTTADDRLAEVLTGVRAGARLAASAVMAARVLVSDGVEV